MENKLTKKSWLHMILGEVAFQPHHIQNIPNHASHNRQQHLSQKRSLAVGMRVDHLWLKKRMSRMS